MLDRSRRDTTPQAQCRYAPRCSSGLGVEPWQSAKTAARLQAATASGKPVLLRVDYHSGHGIGSTRTQRHEEKVDVWSFLLWQFGDPAFQPK